jgi:hypothetical protein
MMPELIPVDLQRQVTILGFWAGNEFKNIGRCMAELDTEFSHLAVIREAPGGPAHDFALNLNLIFCDRQLYIQRDQFARCRHNFRGEKGTVERDVQRDSFVLNSFVKEAAGQTGADP